MDIGKCFDELRSAFARNESGYREEATPDQAVSMERVFGIFATRRMKAAVSMGIERFKWPVVGREGLLVESDEENDESGHEICFKA